MPDGSTFVDLLRADYPATLNLGASGQGPVLQTAAIKEYLGASAPKTVLWIYCEGIDLADLAGQATQSLPMRQSPLAALR